MSDSGQKVVVVDLRKGNLPPANLDIPMPSGAAVPPASGSQQATGGGNQGGGQQNGNGGQSGQPSS